MVKGKALISDTAQKMFSLPHFTSITAADNVYIGQRTGQVEKQMAAHSTCNFWDVKEKYVVDLQFLCT